jgi:ppGpp synthetase/RelA/SpoT-type nucleotidyltranferase
MTDLEEARRRWLLDRPSFASFGEEIVRRLKTGLRKEGIWGEASGRAKEVDSLIRKLAKKSSSHTYESLGDKSGVRVIVRYKTEIERVLRIARQIFECGVPENKVDLLPHDKVGYLSTHVDVRLYKTDPMARDFPPDVFWAELQVRSLAQHLWSEMSHDTVYKNDETLIPLPNPLKRRVFLLAGTIEVADNEYDRLNEEMPKIPEVELLKSLERHYYKLTTRRADVDVSLDAIRWLYPIYQLDPPKVRTRLDEFWDECGEVLQDVYEKAERDESGRSAFLFQPEALMVYDLLRSKEWATRQAWVDHQYPEKELERLANAFGISFDA